jgi:FO synthase
MAIKRNFSFELQRGAFDYLAATLPADLRSALERALEGRDLNEAEALTVAEARGEHLIAAADVADLLRRRTVGDDVTYVVNRNINFTNICFVGCTFCCFGKGQHSPDAYWLSLEEVANRAEEAWQQGATEVCVQGGLPPDMDGTYYAQILRAIKARVPQMHIHAFSPMEVVYGVERTGMALRDYLQSLRDAGLGSLPGTAAEILDDRVRQMISRVKLTRAQWIEVITTAHELGIPSTSTMMYGHVEQPIDWVRHLLLLRSMQKQNGKFTEFVPLGFIHEKTALFRTGLARPGSSVEEDIAVHALSRIVLNNSIPNLQISWPKLGWRISQMCLDAGANDMGGTLMDENISSASGEIEARSATPEQLRQVVQDCGRTAVERSTTYRVLRRFDAPEAATRISAPSAEVPA